jgi:DNA-binding MarR family transcriptional regulator
MTPGRYDPAMVAPESRHHIGADDERLSAWRAFLEAHARVSRRLDDELRANHGLSLAEYDALLQLATAPGRRLRMNQLADRVVLSRSGVTRLIDRLVADGLVERSACTTDARGAEAVLTRDGLDRLRDAAPTHLRGVSRYFLESVAPADLEVIGRSLGAVARGVTGCPPIEAETADPSTHAWPGARAAEARGD